MKTISLIIPNVKPMSINKAYYKRNNQLTKESRKYRAAFLKAINLHQDEMIEFSESFSEADHALQVHITYSIPQDLFFTKQGPVSMRSGDVDNYLKLTLDFLFNNKYFDSEDYLNSGTCYNLGIDDRFVTQLSTEKVPSSDYSIEITVNIIKKPSQV